MKVPDKKNNKKIEALYWVNCSNLESFGNYIVFEIEFLDLAFKPLCCPLTGLGG